MTTFIYIIKTLNMSNWNWVDVIQQTIRATFAIDFITFKNKLS